MRVRTPLVVLVLVSVAGFSSGAWAQTTEPRLLSPATFTDLDYPIGALVAAAEGRVVMNVTVTPAGTTADATIVTSSGSEALDNASVWLAKVRWRFEPATQNGQAVAGTTQVEANWTLPLMPTQHAYFDVPDSDGASLALPNGPYLARYSDYPSTAAAGALQGIVGVRYQVDARGNVGNAEVAVPASYSRFNDAALRIANNRSYTPAMRNGMPVSAWQGMTVSFAVLPSNSIDREAPCYAQPVLARDAVLIGTTPYRVEVSYFDAQYTTRWQTRQVGDWVGTWVQVSDTGQPTEVLLFTNEGWMTTTQPVAEMLTQEREYPVGNGGCWYYDAVSILG